MKQYTIQQFSQSFRIAPSTLRYYEDMGLLTDVGRTDGNQRYYTDQHAEQLKAIFCLKQAGMSIEQQRQFLLLEQSRDQHIQEILQMIQLQQRRTAKKMEQLLHVEQQLARKLWYYKAYDAYLRGVEPMPEWTVEEEPGQQLLTVSSESRGTSLQPK